ncbi:hypothetical protein HZB88_00335 [archaeon]|nr:hypothetical protein [archaeon]
MISISLIWKIILIVIGLLVICLIGHAVFSKSQKRHYRKARRCHKKAEAFYNARDFELAEAYYDKAEEHRRKAKEIEG